MRAIGLRARFFWIIFSVLTIVSLGATALHGFVLKQERLALIDQQVRETATTLLNSELNDLRSFQFDQVDELLSEELGESRIGKFFSIRNATGETIFESTSASVLPVVEVPRSPQWVTIRKNGKLIRALNLELPRLPDRILQVGVLVDESLISPPFFSAVNASFIAFIFLLGLGAAWLLTSTLLKPISRLVDFITGIPKDSVLVLPPLPKELSSIRKTKNKSDEMYRLIESFSDLLEKVNRSHKLSRVWSYQMAHELKTPLAIIEGEISSARRKGEIGEPVAVSLRSELMAASETVTAFLGWAELEGTSTNEDLFANSAAKALREIQRRLNGKTPSRLRIRPGQDFLVLANAQYFEHMLLNLIQNALTYSPAESAVDVSFGDGRIQIADHGPGIPPQVIERMGDPFNRGGRSGKDHPPGHGLGLAYVNSVCKLYGWQLEIKTTSQGSLISVSFPVLESERDQAAEDLLFMPPPAPPATHPGPP